jgi:heat shock protein HslJ
MNIRHARKPRPLIPAIVTAAALTMLLGCTTRAASEVKTASTVSLVGTQWRLTQLGDEIVDNPAGAREIHVVLQSQNQRVTGFAGCNQMMGGYALTGDGLKFDRPGGTMMACEGRMEIEQRFMAIFEQVARWKITGNTLQFLDATGKSIATFEAPPPTSVGG